MDELKNLSNTEFASKIKSDNNAVIIDVRTKEEFYSVKSKFTEIYK